jgi:hypothetical protein
MEAEVGMMQPEEKKCQEFSEATRTWQKHGTDSLQEPLEGW